MTIARFITCTVASAALISMSAGTAQADPVDLTDPAIAQFTQVPNICNQQLDGADGPVVHSGAEISGTAGANYRMHIEQNTTAGWTPMGRGYLMAWVDGVLGDPEVLDVPFGARFRIFVIQSSGGTARGEWRLVAEGPTTQGITLGANLTPVASDITSCTR